MGRWRDGSPLARHPRSPPPIPDISDNEFRYADDPAGERCPLQAHMRVVYSRDQPLAARNVSRFPKGPPRLIRRGFSYGVPLAAQDDDGKDRGIFGVFLCARVNEQFHTVLRWMQQIEFSDVFDRTEPGRAGQDLLAGSRLPGGSNRVPATDLAFVGAGGTVSASLPSFIRYRGVAVMFLPSLSAIRELARER